MSGEESRCLLINARWKSVRNERQSSAFHQLIGNRRSSINRSKTKQISNAGVGNIAQGERKAISKHKALRCS